ncbi:MAG: phage/plasmid primase, P4 family [Lysobacteraceae bacterium]
MTKADLLSAYVQQGWHLVPIPKGQKGPVTKGWNARTNCVSTEDAVRRINGDNIGLAHLFSHTCCVDVDDLEASRRLLAQNGIDLDALLDAEDAVQIVSGRPNRAKLLYRLRGDIDALPTRKFSEGLELRCATKDGKATVQDVLPPSIHPDTGKPYEWAGKGDWRNLPVLPDALVQFWQKEPDRGVVGEGQRNDTLFQRCSAWRGQGWDSETIERAAREFNAANCDPPLSSDEVGSIARGVARYPRGFANTDLGNAERFVEEHGDDTRFVYALKRWLLWDGRRWRFDDNGEPQRRAHQTIRGIPVAAQALPDDMRRTALRWAVQSESASRLASMVEVAKALVPVQVEVLDADPWLFATTNGVIDLRSGALCEPRREYFITKQAHVNYDMNAVCPQWTGFLNQIMNGDVELIRFLQRAVGYSLTGSTTEQCLFILHGTGANGKSVFLNTLQSLLGDYATTAAADTLMVRRNEGPRPDIARLRGSRFVVSTEAEDGQRLAESLIKQLTGQDRVVARQLYSSEFEFTPAFKLWLGTNHKPIVRGDDYAIWRRIHLIPFAVTIPPEQRDKDLTEKLKAEGPGILNWALAGCRAWSGQGLHPPPLVQAATDEYRTEMDVLRAWIEEYCIEGAGDETASALYGSYKDWARDNTGWVMSQTQFGRKMTERYVKIKRGAQKVYLGIRLAF